MSGSLPGGRHDWIGYLQPEGLVVAPAALARIGLWPEPQGPADGEAVARAVAGLAADPWPFFRDVLGWPAARVAGAPGGPLLPDALRIAFREQETLLEPHWAVLDADGAPQLLVRVEAPDLVLDRRGTLAGWEATAQQRFDRLLRETGVGAGVIVGAATTGRREGDTVEPVLRLVVAPRGLLSGHMTWPLARLHDVGGRAMLAGLKLLLDAHALVTGPPSHRLPAMLAESRAAQADVSVRLAGQVLTSLHELLRGLDAADPVRIRTLATTRPQHLYEGLLTVLLRLIFILYAEDRKLMPSVTAGGAAILYEQGYALGALHLRLRDDAALHPDTMDERRGAWGRLMALFRLVDRGHAGFMQARGGTLFGEDSYPFLLGRDTGDDPARVLPVGDGCVLRVLDNLLTQQGERVHYSALTVEQIGSVYEAVMGFTAQVATAPMLAIRAGKGNRVPVWVDLAALAAARPTERAALLKAWTGRSAFPGPVARAIRDAVDVDTLAAALAPVADARACPRGAPVAAGTPILQPTDERRRTGSHYTPPSLSRPIVEHALAPAFARLGPDAGPADILALKVCDPAAGSGALLVEACRQLAERLVTAWTRWPAQRPTIPADEDELLLAKRMVAQHCLHGVDRNPLAIDLAKLALWLETLASAHEFTFLDTALRCGDSLVGLSMEQIVAVRWNKGPGQHGIVEAIVRQGIAGATALRRLIRAEAEIAPYDVQERRNAAASAALEPARLIGDGVLHAYFTATSARDRAARLAEVQHCVLTPGPASTARLTALRDEFRASPIGITSFHWELEFDDVFSRANPGFDAIIGNPPFAGKNTIAAGHTAAYPDWLKTLNPRAHGNADLCAHFFRRAFGLLRQGGAFGLIATNTIRQGDTRDTGLTHILGEGGTITRAVSRHVWEGEAAVVVAQVFVRKGAADAPPVLDGREVRRISAYLMGGDLDGSPKALRENAGTAFQGSILLGLGFTFDDANAAKGKASSVTCMHDLIAARPATVQIVKPYLGAEEVSNSPRHAHHRYAITFGDLPLRRAVDGESWSRLSPARRTEQLRQGTVARDYPAQVAQDWPEALSIVERLVKPARATDNRAVYRDRWWQHAERRVDLYNSIRHHEHVLVIGAAALAHHAFARLPADIIYSHKLIVFALPRFSQFALLQSRVHEIWNRTFGSTFGDAPTYNPTQVFETYPLPPGYTGAPTLDAAGQAYHDHRAALMVARDEGMTPTYNRFHRPADTAGDIEQLRALHHAMDRAVLAAYGWHDLAAAAAPVFLDAGHEDDHRYRGRLFWPAPFRDAVLARLLALNEDRARMERML